MWSVFLSTTNTCHYSFPKHFVLFLYVERFCKSFERKVWRVQVAHLHNAARALSSPSQCFHCQQILAKIYFVIFDIVIRRMWFSVALVKFHWFGINWHCLNQSECRNCCLYFIIQKIAPQAKSRKYFQIWFSPELGGKNGGVLSMRKQVILDSSFARLGSAPIWGGKKGEFRDWTKNVVAKYYVMFCESIRVKKARF